MAEGLRELLDSLLDEQSRSWLSGRRPAVEELLGDSSLRHDPEAQLDLIYNEIVLREQLGERPSAQEYFTRYPHLREALALQFEVHGAMDDIAGAENDSELLVATPKLDGHATISDAGDWPGGEPPRYGHYEVVQLLGRGGMGVVYKARDPRLRRFVALKAFEPGRAPTPRELSRFRTEAESVAKLHHPNVVQIFEVGDASGLPFLALELAEGGTLADRLRRLPFAPRAAAELVETLARAAHHAHERGIVHRDLKPANVLFASDGTPKLTDFGLAKVLEDDPDRDATRTGEAMGTPRYMAPEQAAGRNELAGPATDVYALGTLLFECLTGQVPFVSSSVAETLHMIRFEEPASPRRLQRGVPRDLATICLKCLRKVPGKRYASAKELADDLRRFLRGEPIWARPTPAWERVAKWAHRRPGRAALTAVGVLLLLSGISGAAIWKRAVEKRIAAARDRVEQLFAGGRAALDRDDEQLAVGKLREAWELVQGEPALRDYRLGVSGWLDEAHKRANKYHWSRRVPPPEYPERRDEAFFRSLLLEGDAPEAARESISVAASLTLPNDPAWRAVRERLAVLEADVLLASSSPGAALARLEAEGAGASRLFHERRAACLERLGRREEACAACGRAGEFPPDGPVARFFAGLDLARRRDFAAAAREFEAVLDAEPEHFAARLSLAACALQLGRPGEAKVGLTACVAQRPYCAWGYRLRARCEEALGNAGAAKRDIERAAALQARRP
jgi:tetratricopeptide (TPR) repeat protein